MLVSSDNNLVKYLKFNYLYKGVLPLKPYLLFFYSQKK
jgi:hypothetical protein